MMDEGHHPSFFGLLDCLPTLPTFPRYALEALYRSSKYLGRYPTYRKTCK